jgi:hypothetical protein
MLMVEILKSLIYPYFCMVKISALVFHNPAGQPFGHVEATGYNRRITVDWEYSSSNTTGWVKLSEAARTTGRSKLNPSGKAQKRNNLYHILTLNFGI